MRTIFEHQLHSLSSSSSSSSLSSSGDGRQRPLLPPPPPLPPLPQVDQMDHRTRLGRRHADFGPQPMADCGDAAGRRRQGRGTANGDGRWRRAG